MFTCVYIEFVSFVSLYIFNMCFEISVFHKRKWFNFIHSKQKTFTFYFKISMCTVRVPHLKTCSAIITSNFLCTLNTSTRVAVKLVRMLLIPNIQWPSFLSYMYCIVFPVLRLFQSTFNIFSYILQHALENTHTVSALKFDGQKYKSRKKISIFQIFKCTDLFISFQ